MSTISKNNSTDRKNVGGMEFTLAKFITLLTMLSLVVGIIHVGIATGEIKKQQEVNCIDIKDLHQTVKDIDKNNPPDLDKRLRNIENNIAIILEKMSHDHEPDHE